MRHFDLTPLYRSTVGFDRLASVLDNVLSHDTAAPTYPPYNIEKTDELTIEARDGQLTIAGRKVESGENETRTYLHRGIAERAFERRFQMADHVKAVGATVENGLLHVDLVREVPEALKPRRIPISTRTQTSKTLEATAG